MNRKVSYLIAGMLTVAIGCRAQQDSPIHWEFRSRSEGKSIILAFMARISPGWHLYSQHLPDGGPLPTQFQFDSRDNYKLEGNMNERGTAITTHDETFQMDVIYYTTTVTFLQKVRSSGGFVTGRIDYMVCNEVSCIPETHSFSFDISRKIP